MGTFVVPREPFRALLGRRVSSKALDDRAGFVTLLRAAELLRDTLWMSICILWAAAERETNGGRGRGRRLFSCAPLFYRRGCHPRPYPRFSQGRNFSRWRGNSRGIGPNMTRWMTDRLITKAEARGIPWSPEVMTGHSGTNAWRVQVAREGYRHISGLPPAEIYAQPGRNPGPG